MNEKAEAVVICRGLKESLLYYLKKNEEIYSWCIAEHFDSGAAGCHGVENDHYHLIIWWKQDGVPFNNTGVVSFMKRYARKNGAAVGNHSKIYAFQPVRKLKGLLLYMQSGERKMLWDECSCMEEIKHIDISEKDEERMADYIKKRDEPDKVGADLGVKVNLQSVIDMVIEDGCSSFEQWQREVFRLHKDHDSKQRQALIRILGHPRGEALIRNCETYLKNHVLSMDWVTSMKHKRPLIEKDEEDGVYYSVKESKNWIRRICRHNNWSVNDFVNDIKAVMMRENQKKNCLFFKGPSNAGKSTIATSIRDGWLSVGQVTRSDTFLFMDCVDRQLVFQEECIVKQETVDDWKRMMEGACMKVDIKNKEPKNMRRTPVLVCSNTEPWYWVMNEQKALKNRMFYYTMREMPDLKAKVKDLNPLLWLEWMEELAGDSTSDVETPEPSPPVVSRKRIYSPQTFDDAEVDAIIAGLQLPEFPPKKRMCDDERALGTSTIVAPLPNCDPITQSDLEALEHVFNKYQTQPSDEQGWADMTKEMNACINFTEEGQFDDLDDSQFNL